MDGLDGVGLGERQEVVVALQVALAADEPLPAEMALVEAEPLDLGAHGAIEDQNPLTGRRLQRRSNLFAIARRPRLAEERLDILAHAYLCRSHMLI